MIRPGIMKDVPALVGLALEFHRAAGFTYPSSAALLSVTVADYIRSGDKLCLVHGDVPDGLLLACCGQSALVPVKVADEQLLYVSPKGRGRAWDELRSAYEDWAKLKGCQRIQLTAQQAVRPELTTRLYRRHGYFPSDFVFFKNA